MNPASTHHSRIAGVSPSCTPHLRLRLAFFKTRKRSFKPCLSSSLPLWLAHPRRAPLRIKAADRHAPVSPENIKPHSRFTEEDLKRIKEFGPTIKDLTEQHEIALDEGSGVATLTEVEYIPNHVLTHREYDMEPQWSEIPRMSKVQFYQGVRERNWRSEHYKPGAQPWKLEFFADSGRLFRPIFSGYRVLVTPEGEEAQWVDLSQPGLSNFLEDSSLDRELSAGDCGQRSTVLTSPLEIGYNQILEQLHHAYEEQISPESERAFASKGWIKRTPSSRGSEGYGCPGDKLLDFAFYYTPPEPCLHGTWEILPSLIFVSFAFSFLGVCLFLGIFAPRKQMPTDPMQAMEFAQSKGKARVDGRTAVGFKDVAGLDTIIDDLKEIVKFLQEPKKYVSLGARAPKGVLLDGPPGTGKTLIAKAMAGEAGVPFYQMSGSEFVEAIVGVGAARVRDLFKRARAQDEACVVFVDEIDALGIKRAEAGIQTNEEREQTLNQLLTEMDGFSSDQGVVFVGATNRADLLDPALTRAGRFDKKVRVRKPDTEARHQILQVHTRKLKNLAPDVDLLQLARDLPGVSGADLENIINEAALNAVRREASEINVHDVYDAVDRIIQGLRQPIHIRNMDQMGNVIAGHEAGRAIVAHVLRKRRGHLEAIKCVSIIPRGSKLSRTVFFRMADEEYTLTTKAKLLDRIRVVLSGRAAEDLLFEDPTSYGTKDMESASRLAVKLVANYGMSNLGITTYAPASSKFSSGRSIEVSVDNIDEDLFGKGIGGGLFQPSAVSVHEMRMQAHAIISDAYENCMDILSNYTDALTACSKILLEKEELTGEDLDAIIAKHPPLQSDKEMLMMLERDNEDPDEHSTRMEGQAVSLGSSISGLIAEEATEVR